METYSFLRQLADSWFLLAMVLIFLGIVFWVMFGNSKKYRDTAKSIFRNEDSPAEGKQNPTTQDADKEARK